MLVWQPCSIAEDGGKVAASEKADGPQCRSGEYAVINGNVQAKWGRNTWTREQIDEIVRITRNPYLF